jgi:hypothetical protein
VPDDDVVVLDEPLEVFLLELHAASPSAAMVTTPRMAVPRSRILLFDIIRLLFE